MKTLKMVLLLFLSLFWINWVFWVSFSWDVFPWLVEKKLTSYNNITQFIPKSYITRWEASKFFVQYANLIDSPVMRENCYFFDIKNYDPTLKNYVTTSCKFGIFQWNWNFFYPNDTIKKSQALAAVVRSLHGYQSENVFPWYKNYYNLAKKDGIVTESIVNFDTNISREQLATWIFLAYKIKNPKQNIVYETPAESDSQCSTLESFDATKKVCYFECSNEISCQSIKAQIDAQIQQITNQNSSSSSYSSSNISSLVSSANIVNTYNQVNSWSLAVYQVLSWEAIKFLGWKDTSEYRNLWDLFASLSPDEISNNYVKSYEPYEKADDTTFAYVSNTYWDIFWTVLINMSNYNNVTQNEKFLTLIHEIAHLIFMNQAQTQELAWCQNFSALDLCFKVDSYLNEYVNQFWSPALEKTDQNYVNAYAATNPLEDIAESFAYYVFASEIDLSNNIWKKLNFFNSYPQLVKYRSDMRNAMTKYILEQIKY